MNLVVDTNAYSAFKRNEPQVFEAFMSAETIILPVFVLGELLYGFKLGNRESENLDELQRFINVASVEVVYPNWDVAEVYSDVFINLKRKGMPIPINDVWIASTAMALGAKLISRDKHFQAIDGLRLLSF